MILRHILGQILRQNLWIWALE